jgi:hypothetical protein
VIQYVQPYISAKETVKAVYKGKSDENLETVCVCVCVCVEREREKTNPAVCSCKHSKSSTRMGITFDNK